MQKVRESQKSSLPVLARSLSSPVTAEFDTEVNMIHSSDPTVVGNLLFRFRFLLSVHVPARTMDDFSWTVDCESEKWLIERRRNCVAKNEQEREETAREALHASML